MIKKTIYFGNPAHIRIEYKQLKITLKTDPPQEKSIPVEDIGIVIIDHPQISITSGAISELMTNNVAIIACNNAYMPQALMLPFEGHHTQTQRMHAQINASEPLKKNLWMQTIQAKIYNQAILLEKQGVHHHPLHYFMKTVKSGDSSNREAAAANYYWSKLFANIPNFTRDAKGAYPNNFLNYGYAILRSVCARALVAAGLFPSLGIYHHNKYNAYCLADDIMEPYRTYVDMIVIQIINKYPDKKELDKDIKKELLNIPHIDTYVEDQISPLMIAIQKTATSLAHCFLGEKKKIIYPKLKI
ncbi:MAG: type II CRISPR-associated endonuclease Cas1 [Candidatus Omnitrophica bacterium]|nr:type II CRISPR-associated endonuclease Cas1 [Candidatus Omnitrophota bacterium]